MALPPLVRTDLPSPIGPLTLILADGRLCRLDFSDCANRYDRLLARRFGAPLLETVALETVAIKTVAAADPAVAPTVERLQRYFTGDLTAVDDLAVDPRGTPFQESVWLALRDIPAGGTESYGALAARLGRPTASRAVGLANGANPIAIVLPCHRVIGSNGSLTGYGGGIERKRWLLQHEGVLTRALL